MFQGKAPPPPNQDIVRQLNMLEGKVDKLRCVNYKLNKELSRVKGEVSVSSPASPTNVTLSKLSEPETPSTPSKKEEHFYVSEVLYSRCVVASILMCVLQ